MRPELRPKEFKLGEKEVERGADFAGVGGWEKDSTAINN